MVDHQGNHKREIPRQNRSLVRQVVLIFTVLVVFIVGNTIYSSYRWYNIEHQRLEQELDGKLIIARTILDNEVARIEHINRTIQEQRLKFMELIEYDNYNAIRLLLLNSSNFYDIDLILFIGKDRRVISNNLVAENAAHKYTALIDSWSMGTDITEVEAALFYEHLPAIRFNHDKVLTIRSGIELNYDSGGVAGHIILLKFISNNQNLATKLKNVADTDIMLLNKNGELVLSTLAKVLPEQLAENNATLQVGERSYSTRALDLDDKFGTTVGRIIVAADGYYLTERATRQLLDNILPFVAIIIVLFLLLYLLKRNILDRIKTVVSLQRQVANGVLDARLDASSTHKGGYDEVSIMISHLNVMLDDIQELYAKLRQARREAERDKAAAEAANESKSVFLANMSHEIRTPLTAIIGFAELLDSQDDRERKKTASESIIRNSRYLLHIINEILDLSKIEVNKLEIEKLPVHLKTLMDEVTEALSIGVEQKNLKLDVQYHYPVPVTFTSDPTRIKQILLNLGNNAIKFTEKGAVTMDVHYLESDHKLRFSVRDSGIGMSDEQVERVFEAFEQADSSVTRKYGGTGLGLHISRRLAELLGGSISVESKLGIGTCFEVLVDPGEIIDGRYARNPAELDQVQIDAGAGNKPVIDDQSVAGKVLIAEDGLDNQKLLSLYLDRMGLEYDIANNGKEAVELANQSHYDLILMDIQMPVMSGDEATRKLRSMGYRQPIVALTANVMREDVVKYEQAGCNTCIGKPIDMKMFDQVLRMYLRNSQRPAARRSSGIDSFEQKLLEIEEQFIGTLPERIKKIVVDIDLQQWDTVLRDLHSLKGTSGGFDRCQQISTLAITAEQQFKESEYECGKETVRRMVDAVEEISGSVGLS